MQCPSCKAAVAAGAKFCDQCGQALPRACASCGHANATGAKFCAECGARLSASATAEAAPGRAIAMAPPRPTAPPPSQAERRQLTVLFCDMVGSSALSTQLDPEVQRDLVAAFQEACAKEIKRFDGMIAQYLGDGVLAYFGYPAAHEDDAERAIRAGLAMLSGVSGLRPVPGVRVQARIGIASGVVVVGDLVRQGMTQENAAIGETTNLAARLQALAEPDTLVIAPETHRLVGALFEYHDLGSHVLKGFASPVAARQVLRESRIVNRFEARLLEGNSPLLGREEELELLLRRWAQAKAGEGRVVLISGEAGIGKSRLTRALEDKLSAEAHARLVYHCSPYHQDSALFPVIGQLVRAAGIEREDPNALKLDKLAALVAPTSTEDNDELALLAALLSLPDRLPLAEMTPQQLKERTLAALITQLQRLAARQPLLMLFEDLHWIDPTSSELLTRVVELAADSRILVLATARPEFEMPWPNHRHVGTLALSRLGRDEGRALVLGLTGGKALPSEVLDQIIARTDGVPLFVEELTKTVLESGLLRVAGENYELSGPLPSLAIPSTLHASLLARLDRLGSAKNVAQIGAAIGREFSFRLLSAVTALPELELRSSLDQLVGAGLILRRGAPPDSTYTFKHALVQDAAYGSLLRSHRQQLHGRIARALEENFTEIGTSQPEILARHLSEAGLLERAAEAWFQGATLALDRSAYSEATSHLRSGIACNERAADSDEKRRRDLKLHLALGHSLRITRGHAATETVEAWTRAHVALDDRSDPTVRVKVTLGLVGAHFVRAEYERCGQLLIECEKLANATGQANLLAATARWLGNIDLMSGQFVDARACLSRSLLHGRKALTDGGYLFPEINEEVWSLGFLSHALWILGYPEQAMSRMSDALAHCKNNPWSVGQSYFMEQVLFVFGADSTIALLAFDTAWAHAREHKMDTSGNVARAVHGAYLVRNRNWHHGIELLQRAIDELGALQAGIRMPLYRAYLGFGLVHIEQTEEGLGHLRAAISLAEASHEGYAEAELHRLLGQALHHFGDSEGAEREFHVALAISRRQQARWWELCAAMDLARLWRDQGSHTEARDLLAPVYNWFTEGFDTAGLKEAKALLDELN